MDIINQPWRRLSAWEAAWSAGVCGEGVRVGIFDTGLVDTNIHSHFRNAKIKDRSNWTWKMSERSLRTVSFEIYGLKLNGYFSWLKHRIHLSCWSLSSYACRLCLSCAKRTHFCLKFPSKDNNPGAVDGHGHGTFVTGLISAAPDVGAHPDDLTCPVPGLAPQAELHIFRVFTDAQLSMTSWFLDAFNYAIIKRLHVINLSNGGPDFMDQPFVEKVNELSANGILLVSAIGNDGPVYGTLNNPADMADVLGVGGVDANGDIATFSSRGVTAMEMQDGYGRFKPDVVGWANGIVSSNLDGGCKTLSGTSAASPVVTGSVALLISAALSEKSTDRPLINPASLKQAVIGGAVPLVDTQGKKLPIFGQGAGLLNLKNSIDIIRRLKPQASLWPSFLDFSDCPHFWPYCSQPLYATGIPVIVNVTIINSMGVHGRVVDRPVFHPILKEGGGGSYLDIGVTYSSVLWPWTGHLSLYISVVNTPEAAAFSGVAEGWISLKVESDDPMSQTPLSTELKLQLRVQIIPTPVRKKRILWDAFHNIRYPAAYVPTDDLTKITSPLDWLGDHIHTNFRDLFENLRQAGYFIEVLQEPFTCFDASIYGTLMIVDPEEEFWPAEAFKLEKDVKEKGLSLLVFGGWYNTSILSNLKFYDSNNKRLWVPITGGSNVPALNNLLSSLGIQLGYALIMDQIFSGEIEVGSLKATYPSGSYLASMPTQGRSLVLPLPLVDLGQQVIIRAGGLNTRMSRSFDTKQKLLFSNLRSVPTKMDPVVPVLGLWTYDSDSPGSVGRVAVFGDSMCLDSSGGPKSDCFWLAKSLLDFALSGEISEPLASHLVPATQILSPKPTGLPFPQENSKFEDYSRVVQKSGTRDTPPVYRPLQQCRAGPPRALVAPVTMDKEMQVFLLFCINVSFIIT
ncbi:unnamed protein product [Rodentolepis nana]|uniref:Uncharacterized protein n=1 Tax=Rodentolepis nana TaxID=102285 RepID=A0A3P7SAT9_RODNA|nr:unnamed protein product [Rodentolepis nana]